MNPKLCKRLALTGPPGTRPLSVEVDSDDASVRDQAKLLLSIADIAKSEINTGGIGSLWDKDDEDHNLPLFPLLSADIFRPRSSRLSPTFDSFPRVRSVSIDSPGLYARASILGNNHKKRTGSPLSLSSSPPTKKVSPKLVSPNPYVRRFPQRKQSLRANVKRDYQEGEDHDDDDNEDEQQEEGHSVSFVEEADASSSPHKRPTTLQEIPAKGTPITRIQRKKFSWKNYPELEHFLIVNRPEYLRHSALNYTVQQKQYNNRLTGRLLELATDHGYLFDEKEFSFVTVRDRIRCFFKSYVQSNKKKGVLLGYSARKAGLFSEEELEEAAESTRIIMTP